MTFLQIRHDDVVIQRRVRVQDAAHAVTQVYAVTYPDHYDHGTECGQYDDAERAALRLAEARGLSVWYEECPESGRRILVKTFRQRCQPA